MEDEDYGMCCSKEMAEQCARDYEEWERKETRKELIEIILSIAIPSIIFIMLEIKFGV